MVYGCAKTATLRVYGQLEMGSRTQTLVLIHIWRAFATVQSESHKRLAWDVPEDILDLSKLGILMEKITSE